METESIVASLLEKHLTIATAESCTGGLLAAAITSVAGSSGCFSYGFVTYSNESKHRLLHVSDDILSQYGAVSGETAYAMVQGLIDLAGADIAISITGLAGPDGGSDEKPVGLVYVGFAAPGSIFTRKYRFPGSRENVRSEAVKASLSLVNEYLEGADSD